MKASIKRERAQSKENNKHMGVVIWSIEVSGFVNNPGDKED